MLTDIELGMMEHPTDRLFELKRTTENTDVEAAADHALRMRGAYHHWVYVICLDGGRKLYVGMSGINPFDRFLQHVSGYKASRIVRKYKTTAMLRPDLAPPMPRDTCTRGGPHAYEDACQIEKLWAEKLAAAGWEVYCGNEIDK